MMKGSRGASAVSGATLEVSAGECAVVHGANGAGKTSLGRAVAGYLTHEEVEVTGSIHWDGQQIDSLGVVRRAKLGIAYVPERGKVFREMSVRENLEIFARRRRRKAGLAEDLAFAHEVFPALASCPVSAPPGCSAWIRRPGRCGWRVVRAECSCDQRGWDLSRVPDR